MEFWGLTVQTVGEVLIGSLVIHVHHKILQDRKIDEPVLKDIRLEQYVGVLGLLLIVTGYLMQVRAFA
jgi:hypothetical protein